MSGIGASFGLLYQSDVQLMPPLPSDPQFHLMCEFWYLWQKFTSVVDLLPSVPPPLYFFYKSTTSGNQKGSWFSIPWVNSYMVWILCNGQTNQHYQLFQQCLILAFSHAVYSIWVTYLFGCLRKRYHFLFHPATWNLFHGSFWQLFPTVKLTIIANRDQICLFYHLSLFCLHRSNNYLAHNSHVNQFSLRTEKVQVQALFIQTPRKVTLFVRKQTVGENAFLNL